MPWSDSPVVARWLPMLGNGGSIPGRSGRIFRMREMLNWQLFRLRVKTEVPCRSPLHSARKRTPLHGLANMQAWQKFPGRW